MITLAELYLKDGDYRAARKTLRKAKGVYPEIDDECDLIRGKIELASGDTSRAVKLFRDISVTEPKSEAFYILASTFEIQGEFDKAVAYFDTVATRLGTSDYTALAERKKGLLESRIDVHDSTDSISIDPAKEQFLLAQTYLLSMGEINKALKEYENVVSGYPDSKYAPKALYGIAWLKRYRLDDSGWMQDVNRLLEQYPDSPAAKDASELLRDDTSTSKDS
jgi:tetratricopeptide (TPR) repeat protein